MEHDTMKIVTLYDPVPSLPREFDWIAMAKGNTNLAMVGIGTTEQEAIADLERLLAEMIDCEEGSDDESD
jgi:hypothetical protein